MKFNSLDAPSPGKNGMKKSLITTAGISFLILFSAACGWMISPTGLRKNPPGGIILFQDDFSKPSSGWSRDHSLGGTAEYQNGIYRLAVEQPEMDLIAHPGLSFTDIILDVQAEKIAGPDNNVYGVLCRYRDPENYYFFLISSDGYYGIGKMQSGQRIFLEPTKMHPSPSIHTGDQTNHIHVECRDEHLSLSVNNTLLAETSDSSWEKGGIAFLAGSLDQSGVEVHFDNLLVRSP
jgi:hypothetical protein